MNGILTLEYEAEAGYGVEADAPELLLQCLS